MRTVSESGFEPRRFRAACRILSCLCACVLLLCALSPALALEDWTDLQLRLVWTLEDGTENVFDATPVTWAEGQSFWAQVTPEAMGSLRLQILHPYHDDFTFAPGTGTMLAPANAASLSLEDALRIVAYDGEGNEVDSYDLFVSTQEAPQEPVQTEAPQPAYVSVRYVTEDGTVLLENDTGIQPGESFTFRQENMEGYELVPGSTDAVTVTVDGSGQPSQSQVTFTYRRIVQNATLRVEYRTQDGAVLAGEDFSLAPSSSQKIQARAFDGYVLQEGVPGEVTVSVDAQGNLSQGSVVFTYVPAVQTPASADVTVTYMTGDGSVLFQEVISVQTGTAYTIQARSFDGYALQDGVPGEVTVSVDAGGNISQGSVTFTYQAVSVAPKTAGIMVRHLDLNGNVLREEQVTLNAGEERTFRAAELDGYELAPQSVAEVTVRVSEDGTPSQETVDFYFQAKAPEQVPPAQVRVGYLRVDGSVLEEETVSIPAGESSTLRAKNFDGYTLHPDSQSETVVTVDAQGNASAMQVAFYYLPIQAEPLQVLVPCQWLGTDGKVLHEETVQVAAGESHTFYLRSFEGYEPAEGTQESITVTVDAEGNPSTSVSFVYVPTPAAPLTASVTALYVLEDGTVLYSEPQTVQAGGMVVFSRYSFQGYEALESTPETITVTMNADGTLSPEQAVFTYRLEVQATEVPTEEPYVPASADVTVYWKIVDGTVLKSQTVTINESEPVVFDRGSFENAEPASDTPEVMQVSVDAQGRVTPEDPTFYFVVPQPTATPEPIPATVAVRYVDMGGSALAQDQYVTIEGGTSMTISPDASRVPQEYDPESAGPITVTVTWDGEASPSEVVFTFSHREAEETPIPVGSIINRWSTTNTKGLNVRKGPSKSDSVVTKIANRGSYVWAISSETNSKGESWTKVMVDGKEGYIASEYLEIMTKAKSEDYQDVLETPVAPVTAEPVAETPAPTPTPTEIPATEVPATEVPATEVPTPTEVPATEVPTPTEIPATEVPTPTEVPATPVPEQYQGYALTLNRIALRDEVSSRDSSIITTVPQDTLLQVDGQIYDESGNAWSRVTTLDQVIGFVADAGLRRINAQEAKYYQDQWNEAHATPTPAAFATEAPLQITGYAYTIGDNVPFRNTYSDKSVILSVLDQNTAVYVAGQVYETEDGWPWHNVLYNGRNGFIRSDMLRMMTADEQTAYLAGPATAAPTAQITTQPYDPNSDSSYGYVYVNSNGVVNMRRSASTGSGVVRRMRNYAFCLILGTQQVGDKTWYHVQYDGMTGYILGDYFHQMSLAELEEFLDSEEYKAGIQNNATVTAGVTVTAAPVVSQEQQNVNQWTNPSSGLNVTYATWAPFATTPPLATETATAESSVSPSIVPLTSPTVLPEVSPSDIPIPVETVEVEVEGERRGGAGWIIGLILVLVGGGALYVLYLTRRNARQSAQRDAQRRAQAAQQAKQAPVSRPNTGVYPNQGQPAKPSTPGQAQGSPAGQGQVKTPAASSAQPQQVRNSFTGTNEPYRSRFAPQAGSGTTQDQTRAFGQGATSFTPPASQRPQSVNPQNASKQDDAQKPQTPQNPTPGSTPNRPQVSQAATSFQAPASVPGVRPAVSQATDQKEGQSLNSFAVPSIKQAEPAKTSVPASTTQENPTTDSPAGTTEPPRTGRRMARRQQAQQENKENSGEA
ncbi:MAG: SH3 domain-containing protein [Clostridia bacterium]|nr:SH3 domain-containing protein [Clostridia bacterium]